MTVLRVRSPRQALQRHQTVPAALEGEAPGSATPQRAIPFTPRDSTLPTSPRPGAASRSAVNTRPASKSVRDPIVRTEHFMASDPATQTVHGPSVGTTARFPAGATTSLQASGSAEPLSLPAQTVVELFALGLRIPEPDRTGWVPIAELHVDDDITFAVGATDLENEVALEAIRRAVEHAIVLGLGHDTDPPAPSTQEASDAHNPES